MRFQIRSENADKIIKIEQFNRKARKYGFEEISIEFIEKIQIEHTINKQKVLVDYHVYEISGKIPHFNGWEFVASLDWDAKSSSNIINMNPQSSFDNVPDDLKHGNDCQHCHSNRERIKTYVLFNAEKNKWKKVGSSCVNLFFERDLESYLKVLELWNNGNFSSDEVNDDDFFENYRSGQYHFDLENFLALVIVDSLKFGFISRKKLIEEGKEYGLSTADVVISTIVKREWDKADFNDIRNLVREEHNAKAKKIIEHYAKKELVNSNAYFENLQTLANRGSILWNQAGLAASMVPAYHKELEEENERLNNVEPQWVGNIKDKVEGNLKVVNITGYQSQWGEGDVIRFEDSEKNIYVWFTASHHEMEIGEEYNVKYTIKKHNEYYGKKQNLITRVKVIS